jgi:hypothetical protein
MIVPLRSMPISRTISITSGSASLSSGDSLRFPRSHERCDDVAVAIAEGDDLIALHLLVPAEAKVVAALFRRRCGAVAVNNRRIEEAVLMKPRHRTGEMASMQPLSTHRRQLR